MRTGQPGRARPPLRSLLLVGMLVPVAVLGAHAVEQLGDGSSRRAASVDLRDEAARLGETIRFIAATTDEQVQSTLVGLYADFDLDPDELAGDELGSRDRIIRARDRVDELRTDAAHPGLDRALDALDGLRTRLDRGDVGYAEVDVVFARLDDELEARWGRQMDAIEAAADDQDLSGSSRARLRTLRDALAALTEADDRIRPALAVLSGAASPDDLRDLLVAATRFRASIERIDPVPGTDAAAAWQAFRDDPAAQRNEALLDEAVEVGLGRAPAVDLRDLDAVADALADGGRWALLLAEVVSGAASDLEDAASDQVGAETRDLLLEAVAVAGAVVVSLVALLVIARAIDRPARDLEAAARRIERGDLEMTPPLEPRGPRELATTVEAFNDMTATLAAVERHAVALAEDPDSPVHAEPLPGRTGRAIQGALDRLRSSISAAEQHRAELTELATRDGLTGLLNRSAAMDAVERDLARSRRDGTALLALYVDLDGLKQLNDVHGHAAGDDAIRRTADALAANTREGDVVARLGGDEFLVVGSVPPDGHPGVGAFAARVHDAVSDRVVELDDGSTVHLGCSVGVVVSCPGTETADQLVRAADTALYAAKGAGRGQVAWHTPPECAG